jgi:hypothetical protein
LTDAAALLRRHIAPDLFALADGALLLGRQAVPSLEPSADLFLLLGRQIPEAAVIALEAFLIFGRHFAHALDPPGGQALPRPQVARSLIVRIVPARGDRSRVTAARRFHPPGWRRRSLAASPSLPHTALRKDRCGQKHDQQTEGNQSHELGQPMAHYIFPFV